MRGKRERSRLARVMAMQTPSSIFKITVTQSEVTELRGLRDVLNSRRQWEWVFHLPELLDTLTRATRIVEAWLRRVPIS